MSAFQKVNQSNLNKIINTLSNSFCCLDIVPTLFLKNIFTVIGSDLIQIVNSSLLSIVFPQALKTEIIKPLLKKKNLDNALMQN